MDNSQATVLRDKILEDIQPLMIDGVADGSEKFSLLMRVIQAGRASSEMFTRAYESAKLIEDQQDRLDALLALLDEIDFITAGKENNSASSTEQIQKPNEIDQLDQQNL